MIPRIERERERENCEASLVLRRIIFPWKSEFPLRRIEILVQPVQPFLRFESRKFKINKQHEVSLLLLFLPLAPEPR